MFYYATSRFRGCRSRALYDAAAAAIDCECLHVASMMVLFAFLRDSFKKVVPVLVLLCEYVA